MILTHGAHWRKVSMFLRNQCLMFVFSIYVDWIYDVKLYVQNKCDATKITLSVVS